MCIGSIFSYKASCVRDIYVRACNFSMRTTRGRRSKYGNSYDKYEFALETLCHRRRTGGDRRTVAGIIFRIVRKRTREKRQNWKRDRKETKTKLLQFLLHLPPSLPLRRYLTLNHVANRGKQSRLRLY